MLAKEKTEIGLGHEWFAQNLMGVLDQKEVRESFDPDKKITSGDIAVLIVEKLLVRHHENKNTFLLSNISSPDIANQLSLVEDCLERILTKPEWIGDLADDVRTAQLSLQSVPLKLHTSFNRFFALNLEEKKGYEETQKKVEKYNDRKRFELDRKREQGIPIPGAPTPEAGETFYNRPPVYPLPI
jgi:hypothetical protein